MEAAMNATVSGAILCGSLFLFTLLSGVWLSHSGRPINGVLFTIHKLIALVTVITIGVIVYRLHQAGDIRAIVQLTAIPVTAILFLGLFVTGALLSRGMPLPQAILRIHQVAPLLALASSAATLYLVAGGKP
jgi:hypothetical protein